MPCCGPGRWRTESASSRLGADALVGNIVPDSCQQASHDRGAVGQWWIELVELDAKVGPPQGRQLPNHTRNTSNA
eukprot:6760443-Pyramimonas_sp.AAC.1